MNILDLLILLWEAVAGIFATIYFTKLYNDTHQNPKSHQ